MLSQTVTLSFDERGHNYFFIVINIIVNPLTLVGAVAELISCPVLSSRCGVNASREYDTPTTAVFQSGCKKKKKKTL